MITGLCPPRLCGKMPSISKHKLDFIESPLAKPDGSCIDKAPAIEFD